MNTSQGSPSVLGVRGAEGRAEVEVEVENKGGGSNLGAKVVSIGL